MAVDRRFGLSLRFNIAPDGASKSIGTPKVVSIFGRMSNMGFLPQEEILRAYKKDTVNLKIENSLELIFAATDFGEGCNRVTGKAHCRLQGRVVGTQEWIGV